MSMKTDSAVASETTGNSVSYGKDPNGCPEIELP